MDIDNDVRADGFDRRSFLKRAAVVGGATVWATPTVQSLMAPAFATGSATCPPERLVRFKFDVNTAGNGGVFNSGDAGGDGAEWCLPTGYAEATIKVAPTGSNGVGMFSVDGQMYFLAVVVENKTAKVTLPSNFRVEDLQAKAGNKTDGECDDMDGINGYTASVTLEDKDISFVAGVLCPPPPQQP